MAPLNVLAKATLFFSYNARYNVFYIVVISTLIIVSYKGGILSSTSSFILRNKKGFNISCKWVIYSEVFNSPKHSLNYVKELNYPGSIKFNNDHNSSVLFYIGVPVNNNNRLHGIFFKFVKIFAF